MELAMLQSRNIFIDTSIFIEQNYSYHGSVFQNIVRLSKNGQAKVFVTDITLREVISHIEDDVSKACQATAKLRKDARIFRNINKSPYAQLFEEINSTSTIAELKQQLNDFLASASVETLFTSDVSVKEIFDKYFNRHPPFGDGKKKNEFPDAFVLGALEDWCKKHNERMYVASTDGDLKEYCAKSDNLIQLQKLAEFISLVEFHDEILAPTVEALLEKNTNAVEEAINKEFLDQGFWVDDQEGDVNEVTVKSIEIIERLVLEVDQNTATIQVDAKIKFEADITYDDLETASYDSEDGVLIPWRQINKVVEQQETIEATVYIQHDVEEPTYFKIDHVEINTKNRYGFAVSSRDDEWPYK